MAGSYRIKLSPLMRPYVGRVNRSGRVQRAFSAQIGEPVGACMRGRVKKGMGIGEIHAAARECTRNYKGVKLNLASVAR